MNSRRRDEDIQRQAERTKLEVDPLFAGNSDAKIKRHLQLVELQTSTGHIHKAKM